LLLVAGAFFAALATYHPSDPSWNNSTGLGAARNKIGSIGAYLADLHFQLFGLTAWLAPFLVALLGWRWTRDREVSSPVARVLGYAMMVAALSGALALINIPNPYQDAFAVGGVAGFLLASTLHGALNTLGSLILLACVLVVSIYLVSTFSLVRVADSMADWLSEHMPRWRRRSKATEDAEMPTGRQSRAAAAAAAGATAVAVTPTGLAADMAAVEGGYGEAAVIEDYAGRGEASYRNFNTAVAEERPPWEEDIPIRPLEPEPFATSAPKPKPRPAVPTTFELPPTRLLNVIPEREGYDSAELKDVAARIKSKLEEFNVLGNVSQINPGPVVTTFEFKPDAGVKIARITGLSEDLCLGLQAESILIERIPGKPTVGIQVPNTRRETISLRQILESDEFGDATSHLAIALGKDISGRIRVTELDKMPHLLIAGSTGSGKSVMLNGLIMSILYKSTPDQVRLIMVDPKRVELGIYDGIPHLLTPVITEPKKAVNALRNAVLEMERRLKLLASHGVRNIDQFNRKLRQADEKPRSLFEQDIEAAAEEERERPLPYILIVIDELADLMMLERAGVEESVIRLAQMARAVGMHLVLATQRPSVDVITGLIKANFPARISFRVATRVDSRTVLDVMGAEHLLGKGDMLFLPPGSSRLLRVHGAFVTESEISEVVDFWRTQAQPDYDQSYLIAPPSTDEDGGGDEETDGEEDPLYRDAVRVVCEMGKASTSILQRRLRLGYGRAARILDQMQREGIIGPPDGPRPREVLRRPDWLDAPGDDEE
jgi:S-DNA-T family DNA segregation ATPase FtsK/SpoIIIE